MRSPIAVLIQITSLKDIKHFVFVTEAQCVYCEVRSGSTYIHFSLTEGRTGTLRSKHNFYTASQLVIYRARKISNNRC